MKHLRGQLEGARVEFEWTRSVSLTRRASKTRMKRGERARKSPGAPTNFKQKKKGSGHQVQRYTGEEARRYT